MPNASITRPQTMKALADVLVLQGKPRRRSRYVRKCLIRRTGSKDWRWPGCMKKRETRKRVSTCCCGSPTRPDPAYAEEYWLLLANVATQLGQDTYASKAYEKVLSLRPNDVEVLEHLQRWRHVIAMIKKANSLAHYGWDRLQRIEDLQRLMRFSWKRKNWRELDHWLCACREMRRQPTRWRRRPITGTFAPCEKWQAESGTQPVTSLQRILRLRGPDPEVTEAMIWLLLSDKQIDHLCSTQSFSRTAHKRQLRRR